MLGEVSFIDLLFLELRCCALGNQQKVLKFKNNLFTKSGK